MSLKDKAEKGFEKPVAEEMVAGATPTAIAEALEVANNSRIKAMLQSGHPDPALLDEPKPDVPSPGPFVSLLQNGMRPDNRTTFPLPSFNQKKN